MFPKSQYTTPSVHGTCALMRLATLSGARENDPSTLLEATFCQSSMVISFVGAFVPNNGMFANWFTPLTTSAEPGPFCADEFTATKIIESARQKDSASVRF